ncbi:hypothetical protein GGR51DRAFT_529762 [Nemania sp. FL0031]|nr:hypothetical protein GGR51DRAFT_529762 [Nemania sp. FL0031]
MLGSRIIVDGLWRCLCPSVDIVSLSKPFDLYHVLRTRPTSRCGLSSKAPRQQCRRQHSHAAAQSRHNTKERREQTENARVAYLKRLAKRNPWIPGAAFQDSDAFNIKLDGMSTRTIYAALKELQDAEDTYLAITRFVEYLVKERGEQPNAALYESLIKANINTHYGSAKVAAQLLKEAQSHGIATTPEMYQGLLEVTAVHPDYVLRAQVLHDMKTRWYNLTPSAEVSIIISLLRDGQYELALWKLEELNKVPINVPSWLFDVFLYTFGELGFHEETLAILKNRQRIVDTVKRAPLSFNASQFLLDVFSRDAFHPGIKYVWDHSVTPGHIHPPDGVVLNVLNTASMHGDAMLAMSAIRELSARKMTLSMHHYEALIHVHIRQNDLRKALTILCIMSKAGLSPDLSSTRPIFQMLRDSQVLVDQALGILHDLKLQYIVPAAAFNVVLESTAAFGNFRIAFDLYRTIRQVCANGPDLETFEILLQHCTMRKSMNFLVAEIEVFRLKPSRSILDHLVRICSLQDDYEMAFRYLEMMRDRTPPGSPETWWVSRNSALALLRRCIQTRDQRFEHIFEESRRRRLVHEDDVKSLMSVGAQYASASQSQPSSSDLSEQDRLESAKHSVPNVMFAQA